MKFNLNTRDLVNVGVFTVIYFIVFFALGMIGIAGPQFMFVGWALAIILNGFVIILYLARTPKMGALTLLALFTGLIMLGTGHPWFIPLTSALMGFLGDLIATRGGQADRLEPNRGILAYAVATLWYVFPLLPIFWSADEYYAGITEQMGAEYAEGMRALFTTPVILMWSVLIFVLGMIGGWLGTRAFRKHFQRAGLAR